MRFELGYEGCVKNESRQCINSISFQRRATELNQTVLPVERSVVLL
jgi:hypothetical protein